MTPFFVFFQKKANEKIIFWVLFLLPVLFLFGYVLYVSSNVIFADEWTLIPMLDSFFKHQLIWQDLWVPLNEHRIVLIKVLFLLSAVWLQMNTQVLMLLSVVCLVATSILFYRYFMNHIHHKYAAILYLPIHYLLLSVRQWENFIMGLQLFNFAMILCMVVSLFLMDEALDKNNLSLFWTSLGVAFIGTLFWGVGIFTFLLLIMQFLWHPKSALKKKRYILPVLCGALLFVAYFFIYGLGQESHIPYIMVHLPEAFLYSIVSIGNSLIGEFANTPLLSVHLFFGSVLCLLYIVVLRISFFGKKEVRQKIPAVAILFILFSLAMSLLLTYSRVHFGILQAATSRYATLTMLGGVGLYLAVVVLWTYSKKYTYLFGMVLMITLLGVGISTFEESRMMPYRKAYFENLVFVLKLPAEKIADDLLQPFNVPVAYMRQGIPFLQRYGLSVYVQR